jgi:ATP-dependent protease ClpP protease subunit
MPKWFTVKNEATAPSAEILIYDKIGKDWWSNDGIAAKDFNESLKGIPADREITCRINSVGGNVWDGMAIYSMLHARKDKVTCHVEGVAASISSVIACAGKKLVMPKNSLLMMHPPSALPQDSLNAQQCRDLATKLDVHAKAIASVYASKTGKSEEEMLAKVNSGETWMSGEDAKDFGLCDEVSDEIVMTAQVKDFDFSQFRAVPGSLRSKQAVNNKEIIMNKDEMVALLRERGVTVANDATDAWIKDEVKKLTAKPAATPPTPAPANNVPQNVIDLQNQVTQINNQLAAEKKTRIEAIINGLVTECRVTAAEAPKAILRAVADETYLDELRNRPAVLPGSEPVRAGLQVLGEDVRNVIKGIEKHVVTGPRAVENATERGAAIGAIYAKEREKIIQVLNAGTNTISADLKRVAILQETIRAFATRLLPLRLFSTVFGNVPLQGTDEVVVPYFPLQTAASTDFVQANGYVFAGATNSSSKKITVNKRKYQPLDYSSNDFRRQPYFDAVRLGAMNAEKLGVDVLMDILSVVTLANFGAAAKTLATASWTSDDIVDMMGACNDAMWPDAGRSFIMTSALNTVLQKDNNYQLAINIGGTEVIRGGKLPNISGFDVAWMPNLPANGQNLIAFAAFASAILSAFAPVDPAAGVRQQLLAYEVATDPATGISFNYRHWGNPDADVDREVIECAYGYAAGEAAAIKRAVSA